MEGASWTAMVDQDPLSQGIPNTTFIRGSRTSHLHKFCGGFSASTAASDPPQEATYLLSGRSLLNSTIGAEVANQFKVQILCCRYFAPLYQPWFHLASSHTMHLDSTALWD
eukprot:GHVN01037243.1.p2 GENE.GHVN01037243.1~~GHVN01037243.1.p2  ORF type:complete len:111 (+),score=2.42 GHVN01037243.1:706-1038(+)